MSVPGNAAPRACRPGAWISNSRRISGAKYETCGPKTAIGFPPALRVRPTEERAVRLVAAPDREDGLDERCRRDDVGRSPGRRQLLESGVLGGEEVGVRERRLDVGIDPVDVGLAVGHDLLPLRVC